MKIILRILAILAAALLVTGALLAFGRSGLAQSLRSGPGGEHAGREWGPEGGARPERGAFEQGGARPERGTLEQGGARPERGTLEQGRPPFGRDGFERGDHHGGGLFGLANVLTNLAKIGMIVAVVALGARLLSGRKDRGDRDPPPATGETTRL